MTAGLLQALVPLFFVLALGYGAGRFHAFDGDQASGFNKLLVNFALPAMLFASTVMIKRDQMLQEGPVVLTLIATFLGLFLAAVGLFRGLLKRTTAEAAIAGLLASSSAAPFFGPAVLTPLFGATSGLAIALAALVINVVQVPLAIVMIEAGQAGTGEGKPVGSVLATVAASVRQPVVVAPVVALVLALTGLTLPAFASDAAKLIGSATSGVAVFASGLTMAEHKLKIDRDVVLITVSKLAVLPALMLGLTTILGVRGSILSETVVSGALSSGLIALILASKYKTYLVQAASSVLLSAVGMAVSLPIWILLLPNA